MGPTILYLMYRHTFTNQYVLRYVVDYLDGLPNTEIILYYSLQLNFTFSLSVMIQILHIITKAIYDAFYILYPYN